MLKVKAYQNFGQTFFTDSGVGFASDAEQGKLLKTRQALKSSPDSNLDKIPHMDYLGSVTEDQLKGLAENILSENRRRQELNNFWQGVVTTSKINPDIVGLLEKIKIAGTSELSSEDISRFKTYSENNPGTMGQFSETDLQGYLAEISVSKGLNEARNGREYK